MYTLALCSFLVIFFKCINFIWFLVRLYDYCKCNRGTQNGLKISEQDNQRNQRNAKT